MDIKKVLLHIATPFAGILTFVIACLLARLFQIFQTYISRFAPLDYQAGGPNAWIWNVITPIIGMVGLYFVVESIAPSKHVIHFTGVVIFLIILCAIEIQLLWLPLIVLTIGLIIYLYYNINTEENEQLKKVR